MAPLPGRRRCRGSRVAARVAPAKGRRIESLLTKTTFDICNLRLIGHGERMNSASSQCPDPCHSLSACSAFLYFRNSLRVASHTNTDTHTHSRTLERFASITLRILLAFLQLLLSPH